MKTRMLSGVAFLALASSSLVIGEPSKVLVHFEVVSGAVGANQAELQMTTVVLHRFSQSLKDEFDLKEAVDSELVAPGELEEGKDISKTARERGAGYYVVSVLFPPVKQDSHIWTLRWKLFQIEEPEGHKLVDIGGIPVSLESDPTSVLIEVAQETSKVIRDRVAEISKPEVIFTWCFTCSIDELRNQIEVELGTELPDLLAKEMEGRNYEVTGIGEGDLTSVCANKHAEDTEKWEASRDEAEFVIHGIATRRNQNTFTVKMTIKRRSGREVPLRHVQRFRHVARLAKDLAKLIDQEWGRVTQVEAE